MTDLPCAIAEDGYCHRHGVEHGLEPTGSDCICDTDKRLTRPCGHGRFVPNGLYRPLQEGDHYMGTDFHDPPPGHNWENYAYTHTCDSDDDVCFVILSCLEDCPNGDDCTGGLA